MVVELRPGMKSYLIRWELQNRLIQFPQYQQYSQFIMKEWELKMEGKEEQEGAEDLEKQTGQMRAQGAWQFEKNYPKNIFIPMIEFLASMGLQKSYEESVGTREEFEGKNVVSLSLIHKLVSEQWFVSRINKTEMESNISNKVLLNSKIKRKLFHLKATHILLNTVSPTPKLFKKQVSSRVNSIASSLFENHELFQSSSSIIYLLNLFLESLSSLQEQPICKIEVEFQSDHSLGSSKIELKTATKQIISVFNHSRASPDKLEQLQKAIKKLIQQRQEEVNRIFLLAPNVPNWGDFSHIIVSACFDKKRKGLKITNSMLNRWVQDYKNKTYNLGLPHSSDYILSEHAPSWQSFVPLILISPPEA